MTQNKALTFEDYQLGTAETAKYPGAFEGNAIALSYLGLGLGEAGEVQGKIKKILRDAGGEISPEAAKEIGKELGDVLWYVGRMADELGFGLEDIAQANLDKLADRKARGVIGGSGDNR